MRIPKCTLGPDAQILQNKPYASLRVAIRQFEGTNTQTSDEVAGEHASWLLTSLRLHLVWSE